MTDTTQSRLPRRRVVLGLGSNWEGAPGIMEAALEDLRKTPGLGVMAVSRFRLTRPIGGPPDQPPYVNAVAVVETDLSPQDVLVVLQAIEQRFGRQRDRRWAARTLDLDILLDEAGPVLQADLVIPHPRLGSRRFFLEAIAELSPQAWHFWSGLSVGRLLSILNETPPWVIVIPQTFAVSCHSLEAILNGKLNEGDEPTVPPGAGDISPDRMGVQRAVQETQSGHKQFTTLTADRELDLPGRLGLVALSSQRLLEWWQELEAGLKRGQTVLTGLPPQMAAPIVGAPLLGDKAVGAAGSQGPSLRKSSPPVTLRGVILRPRMVILGPLAARPEFWAPIWPDVPNRLAAQHSPPLAGGFTAAEHSRLLSRIRQLAPVVLVESDNPRDWPEHLQAALAASRERGSIFASP